MSEANVTPPKTPKAMSSRLLTMKFMQRAAASSPVSTPSAAELPSPKRQKRDDSSPISLDMNSFADRATIRSALAIEEAKRQALLDRQAAEAGDTRWVLNFESDNRGSKGLRSTPLRTISAGYAAIDYVSVAKPTVDEDDAEERPRIPGRRSFGKFNRMVEKLQDPMGYESSESGSSDEEESHHDSDASDDSDPTQILIKSGRDEAAKQLKAERKAKKMAEKAQSLRLAAKRKKKDIKLNRLTSISGGSNRAKQTCHRCGEVGHIQAECHKRGRTHRTEEERAAVT